MTTVRFLIDGMLSGTGIRDAINGGYVDPMTIGLSEPLLGELAKWQGSYQEAHFAGFPESRVAELDNLGVVLTQRIAEALPDYAFGYFSDGLMKQLV